MLWFELTYWLKNPTKFGLAGYFPAIFAEIADLSSSKNIFEMAGKFATRSLMKCYY